MDLKFSNCANCGENKYTLIDGYYFCDECGVRNEQFIETEFDFRGGFEKLNIIKVANDPKKNKKSERRMTSWEEYNYILLGLTEEVSNIEDTRGLKATVLRLWITYLKETEAAFFSLDSAECPKLFACYRDIDAEILFNKKERPKKTTKRKKKKVIQSEDTEKSRKKRMKKSEKNIAREILIESESNMSSNNMSILGNMSIDSIISFREQEEMDIEFTKDSYKVFKRIFKDKAFEKEMMESLDARQKIAFHKLTAAERTKIVTGSTLLSIIWCASNICGSKIQISDLVRFVREGNISYFTYTHFLPEDYVRYTDKFSHTTFHSNSMIRFEYFRYQLTAFIKYIPDLITSIKVPNLSEISKRYLTELHLPPGLNDYIDKLITFFPPEMHFKLSTSVIPNYEGRAMAYIIFVLKLIFGLDDKREKEMSDAARKLNVKLEQKNLDKLFVFDDWKEFIEYRKRILSHFYFPLLFHHDSIEEKPYLHFVDLLDTLQPKIISEEEPTSKAKNVRSKAKEQAEMNCREILKKLIRQHNMNESSQLPTDNIRAMAFKTSMTPMKDYFEHVLSSYSDKMDFNKDITNVDHTAFIVEPFLTPKIFQNKLDEMDISIKLQKTQVSKNFDYKKAKSRSLLIQKCEYDLSYKVDIKGFKDQLEIAKDIEEKKKKKTDQIYQRTRKGKILAERRKFRKMIANKIQERKQNLRREEPGNLDDTEIEDEDMYADNMPTEYRQPTILDDLSSEEEVYLDVDELFDDISGAEDEADDDDDDITTFFTPNFNFWHRFLLIRLDYPELDRTMEDFEKLPKNFQWLVKECATILHQQPLALYLELQVIENQFINVFQPVELVDNVIEYRNDVKFSKLMRRIARMW
ncbi:unnamed protein product [Diamesa hyperborea]